MIYKINILWSLNGNQYFWKAFPYYYTYNLRIFSKISKYSSINIYLFTELFINIKFIENTAINRLDLNLTKYV